MTFSVPQRSIRRQKVSSLRAKFPKFRDQKEERGAKSNTGGTGGRRVSHGGRFICLDKDEFETALLAGEELIAPEEPRTMTETVGDFFRGGEKSESFTDRIRRFPIGLSLFVGVPLDQLSRILGFR
jgi:hypothetical protein